MGTRSFVVSSIIGGEGWGGESGEVRSIFWCRCVLLIWIIVWQRPTVLAVGWAGRYFDYYIPQPRHIFMKAVNR